MPNTDRFSMLERWANGAEAFAQAIEDKYGPAPTPPQLPQYTIYDAMLEAIADNTVEVKRLLNKKSPTYHSDSVAYAKTVPSGDVHYASLEQIGGKTLVFNQLVNPANISNRGTISSVGLSLTTTGNGEITINGTSTQANNVYFISPFSFIIGHKYLLACDKYGDGNDWWIRAESDTLTTRYGATIATISAGATRQIQFAFENNVTFNNMTIRPQIIDLTLLYGAGNEPSTVAEFQKQFPADYYAYNQGSLLSAGVTEVVSVGKNLFDKTTAQSGYINDNTGNVVASATSICTDYIGINPTLKYYIKSDAPNGRYGAWYNYNKQFISGVTGIGEKTPPSNAQYIRFTVSFSGNGDVDTFCINVSNASYNGNYYPYNAHTYPIPAEIQALEGYGWSAGSVYNYIDFENKKFVQNVGKAILDGTQVVVTSSFSATTCKACYAVTGSSAYTTGGEIDKGIISSYLPASSNSLTNAGVPGIHRRANGSSQVYVSLGIASGISDATAFNAYLLEHPLTVYYELATPVETDISAYLTDDNLIEVESGGTLTFPNSNGDDYTIPVPSSETFVVGEP